MAEIHDLQFPCSLVVDVPLPTQRLAFAALQALEVDKELSPLVHRSFSVIAPDANAPGRPGISEPLEKTVLRTEYKATTNRMLRVAVNGFMESLVLVLQVMGELDVDILESTLPG